MTDVRSIHTPAHAPEIVAGEKYICTLNGTALYEASVKSVSGCWATVQVVQPLPSPHERQYHAGQEFEIRVASYTFKAAREQ